MYVHVHVHLYENVSACVGVYKRVYVCIYIYVYIHVYIYIYTYLCIGVRLFARLHARWTDLEEVITDSINNLDVRNMRDTPTTFSNLPLSAAWGCGSWFRLGTQSGMLGSTILPSPVGECICIPMLAGLWGRPIPQTSWMAARAVDVGPRKRQSLSRGCLVST